MRWIVTGIGLWSAAIIGVGSAPLTQAPPTPAGQYRPPPAPVQPIAYSHKTHLNIGLECAECHKTATTEDQATLPPTSTCMSCHVKDQTVTPEIQKLTGYATKNEPVPWRRVYQGPDYVYFSHKTHIASDRKNTCATCHGDVPNMDVMQKVKDISMAACIECHKAQSAPILCDSCHERRD